MALRHSDPSPRAGAALSTWRYATAAETRKPGYLKRKFDKIKREQAEQKAATEAKVQPMRKVAAK